MNSTAHHHDTVASAIGNQGPHDTVLWLEQTLPRVLRRLVDSEDLDIPYFQLPLAQMRLAHALYRHTDDRDATPATAFESDTMGHLSERLGVRQNALTQAADRLVGRGLAERFSDPHDRRIVRLRLTSIGHAWVEERHARRRASLARLWECLNQDEQQSFLQAIRTLEAAGERLRAASAATAEAGTRDSLVPGTEMGVLAPDAVEPNPHRDVSASETIHGRM